MGVPGFYSWLIKRYPMVKHMVDKYELPAIDYLYLDMNGIIYKCVKDDSIIFKSQILPKELEEIWLEVFNYIDMIVNILKPTKMLIMALDGVAPRSKMNNQRSRRFKSARDHQRFMETYYGFMESNESQENFKNNSISPGTKFMEQLNKNIDFFIKKKIEQDDYWKQFSVIFTGSDVPGEGQHKIMEFIRANSNSFEPEDNHCLYGADADLIMLSMTLPLKNLCIIRQQFIPSSTEVKIIKSKQKKTVNFEIIFITILREYFEIEYQSFAEAMKMKYNINQIMQDFVFLFFFIGNDFLPRCMAYNIRESSIEYLIRAFKQFLVEGDEYITGGKCINLHSLTLLSSKIAIYEQKFLSDKIEEFEKVISEKKEFQNDLISMTKETKAKNERQFLLELKTSYMNQSTEGKKKFYEMKFQINPETQTQIYYWILYYYLYGLEFVYEYYFAGLPSWQWYYPYYYAPLLSDLNNYVMMLAQNGHQIQKINPGQPFPPFKQLMCILPKQSSELLPEPFQEYLTSPDSPLRKDIDFYPDEFEDDMYGSTRPHEAISLIPFLNLELINKVYEEALLKTNQIQLSRNKFGSSLLYQYNGDGSQIMIESNFKSIEVVRCTIDIENVNMRQKLKWKTINQPIAVNQELERMPSLKILKFEYPKQVVSKSIVLHITPKLQEQSEKFKLGSPVYYGYPLEHSGKVQAILTYEQILILKSFDPHNYQLEKIDKEFVHEEVLKKQSKRLFDNLISSLSKSERNSINWTKTKKLIFIRDTMSFVRCADGKIKRIFQFDNKSQFVIKPEELVSHNRAYETTRDDITYKSIKEQFRPEENVLVFPTFSKNSEGKKSSPQQILKGKVVGYTENNKVKVQVQGKIKGYKKEVLKDNINTVQVYFSLKFSAFMIGIKPQILLTMLDSISIVTESADLPKSIDIGLNYICRRQKKLVSNLVRIQFSDPAMGVDNIDYKKQFKNLQISYRGLQVILEYKEKFPNVIDFIVQRHDKLVAEKDEKGNINWKQVIALSDIFKEGEKDKAIKSLMNVYLWLIKKDQTHMPLSSVFSKQVSAEKISKMLSIFEQYRSKSKNIQYQESQIKEFDPNYLFSRRLSNLCQFHLSTYNHKNETLEPHTIRDQVVCLKSEFFGDYGVVVGVDGDKYEVLFTKPRFGKTTLNGLCQQLYGGKFSQRELFNMDIWPQYMRPRSEKQTIKTNMGYLGGDEIVIPKWKESSIDSYKAIQLLEEKKKGTFSQKFLNFIQQLRKREHVEKIDPEFNIVDKKNNYKYKYDKGKSNIQPKYIQKIVKAVKYRQKEVSQIVQEMSMQPEFEAEKIESIIAPVDEQENKDNNEDEEDGDDILK